MCSNEKLNIVYIVCINVMHRVYGVAEVQCQWEVGTCQLFGNKT